MLKNKLKLFGVAAMLLTLVSCNSVKAEPDNRNDPLVTDETGGNPDLQNNDYGVVYDDLVENGTVNSVVFSDLMYKIANKELVSYYEGEDKMFESKDAFDEEVNKLINEKLYDYISSSSFLTDHHFDESKLVISLKQNLYKIEPGKYASGEDAVYNRGEVVFTPETRVSALENGNLGGDGTVDENDILHYDYTDYKERVLKREVYTQLLVAKYLEDESYSALGRAYARKVSYIAIEKNPAHPDAARNTIDAFVHEYVTNNKKGTVDLNDLAKLWKGVDYSNEDGVLSAELKGIIDQYALRTLADDIIDDFKKVVQWDDVNNTYAKNPVTGNSIPLDQDVVDTALMETFTANNSHLPEVGKEQKDIELAQKTLVTEGWFIKNGGLTELPDAIRSRLFNLYTANDFQAIKNGSTEDLKGYVRSIHDVTYLIPDTTQNEGSDSDIVFYDRDTSTYYIVIIEDALNASALNLTNLDKIMKNRYPDASEEELANLIAEEKIARRLIAHEVSKMLATRSSYQSEATIFYLKKNNIVFHDEDIYNYFKENYGDMFEDEE